MSGVSGARDDRRCVADFRSPALATHLWPASAEGGSCINDACIIQPDVCGVASVRVFEELRESEGSVMSGPTSRCNAWLAMDGNL